MNKEKEEKLKLLQSALQSNIGMQNLIHVLIGWDIILAGIDNKPKYSLQEINQRKIELFKLIDELQMPKYVCSLIKDDVNIHIQNYLNDQSV